MQMIKMKERGVDSGAEVDSENRNDKSMMETGAGAMVHDHPIQKARPLP